MRELKFRAFHKPTKKMFDVGMIDMLYKRIYRYISYISLGESSCDGMECYETEYCELMQYTGLKDCKGKRIYEGDIIENSNIGLIAKVCWDNEYCGYSLVNNNFVASLLDYNPSIYYTVIGNIYQNPELLPSDLG